MAEKIKPVEIIGVDAETVEKDDAFPKAYAFYINLSEKPEDIWQRYFEVEWRQALYTMKKEITVIEDKLRLVFGEGENIEGQVRFARQLVEKTNERIRKHNQQIELEEKQELAKQEEIEKKKEEIRKRLREMG